MNDKHYIDLIILQSKSYWPNQFFDIKKYFNMQKLFLYIVKLEYNNSLLID